MLFIDKLTYLLINAFSLAKAMGYNLLFETSSFEELVVITLITLLNLLIEFRKLFLAHKWLKSIFISRA